MKAPGDRFPRIFSSANQYGIPAVRQGEVIQLHLQAAGNFKLGHSRLYSERDPLGSFDDLILPFQERPDKLTRIEQCNRPMVLELDAKIIAISVG